MSDSVTVPVTYQREWMDGFGARGWKLDVAIGENNVIAATAASGERIPTSVLVHDILDHHLCGFCIGGHRNEAMALIQLGSRTGSDPRVDFRQIVDEDILHGYCNGESLRSFLPRDLTDRLPAGTEGDRDIVDYLRSVFGEETLRKRLVEHFVEIGESVQADVEIRWRRQGLAYERRDAMGLAMQRLLEFVDGEAVTADWAWAHGEFVIGNQECKMILDAPVTRSLAAKLECSPT